MFEKEAEEYIEKLTEDWDDGEYSFSVDDMRKAILYFAEFGYNKANEWHKQSDNDDIYNACNDWSVHYFFCKMKDGSYNMAFGNCDEDCNGGVNTNIVFEFNDEKYYTDDILMWLEIPKCEE